MSNEKEPLLESIKTIEFIKKSALRYCFLVFPLVAFYAIFINARPMDFPLALPLTLGANAATLMYLTKILPESYPRSDLYSMNKNLGYAISIPLAFIAANNSMIMVCNPIVSSIASVFGSASMMSFFSSFGLIELLSFAGVAMLSGAALDDNKYNFANLGKSTLSTASNILGVLAIFTGTEHLLNRGFSSGFIVMCASFISANLFSTYAFFREHHSSATCKLNAIKEKEAVEIAEVINHDVKTVEPRQRINSSSNEHAFAM